MCGRYCVDDETSREIQKIVGESDKKLNHLKIKTGEIYPTNEVPILMVRGKSIALDMLKWGFPNFSNKGLIINARHGLSLKKRCFGKVLFPEDV